tara:strand:+ start:75 stop:455 length:381 start_codon:yes stop_codon:yes gene_type:complete
MYVNTYNFNTKYNIYSLNKLWTSKDDDNIMIINKKNWVIFKKVDVEPFMLSKINYCVRNLIKKKYNEFVLKILCDDIEKKKNIYLPVEINNLILKFIGYKDKVYFTDDDDINKINYIGCNVNLQSK